MAVMWNSDPGLSFGEWLRRRRGGFGLTQADLARQLGCAPITLRKIEAEERRPSLEMAQRMAEVLRVPAEQRDAFMRFARGEVLAGQGLNGVAEHTLVALGAHLPNPPYAIIGRDDILAHASDAIFIDRVRVLTLVGPPGVGKTRLALELAHTLRPKFADGAAFVELAPLGDARLVASAVAQVLGIAEGKGDSSEQAVIAYLRNRQFLLVLDNFEHMLDAAPFIAELVAECADVNCLVTSRERLRLRAEQLLPVPALPLPATHAVEDVQRASSAQLFAARASAVNPQFRLDDTNAGDVAELCERLDGLPLAIELIAARAEILSPAQIVSQLEFRLPVLVDGPRDLPARQQTLRDAIRWSFDRLTSDEQHIFAHMGVFAGGFTADAAQAVLGEGASASSALGISALEGLQHASLLQKQIAPHGEVRYGMLETIREFALEELTARDESQAARKRHAYYFARLATTTRSKIGNAQQGEWYRQLTDDLDNIRATLHWAQERGRYDMLLEVSACLYHFWWQRGLASEGLRWLDMALPHRDQATMALQAEALVNAGILAYQQDEYAKAESYLLDALQIARDADHHRLIRATLANLGILMLMQGKFDRVEPYLAEAIEVSRANNDEAYARFTLTVLGDLRYRQGQFANAKDAYTQALSINQTCNDEEGIADSLWGLARTSRGLGKHHEATQCCDEAQPIYRKLDHEQGEGWVLNVRADIARDTGHLKEAIVLYRKAIDIRLKHEDKQGCTRVLDETAQAVAKSQRWELAVRLMGAADQARTDLGGRMTDYEREQRDRTLGACRAALGERECEAAWSHGQSLSLPEAIGLVV
jgi:predicted ATPase/DNA-binding XRE family transcriptional regulator/predicted negative regulator of RcsB-dependent stress response